MFNSIKHLHFVLSCAPQQYVKSVDAEWRLDTVLRTAATAIQCQGSSSPARHPNQRRTTFRGHNQLTCAAHRLESMSAIDGWLVGGS
jgi:hypothetical protein